MLSFPLLCRSRSFAVPAKVTLTCFFALVGLAVFVLGTALSPAQAQYPGGGYPGTTGTGHYDVSYSVTAGSGSTATYTTSGYPGSGASVSGTDSNSCYTSYGSSPTTYHIAANSALTATFTWNNENNPANLPPSCAIINQGSSASWSAQAQGCVPTGDCDPGLPNPVYTSGYLSKSGTATLYTVKSGSGGLSRITLAPVTPTASSDGTSGSAGGSGASGTVNVSYTASATPVSIKLDGTTKDSSGNLNILVGQHCSASLPGLVIPSGAPVSYQWSVSGTTFQTWSADTPAVGGNSYNPDVSYEVDGPGPLTNPTAGWYWNDLSQTPTPETVSCTATVTPPSGQGSSFTVTVTQKVTVYRPNWTATGTGGNMQVNNNFPGSTDYYLWAGPVPGNGGGMDWRATVSPPSATTFGAGSLVLVQLIIPDLSFTTYTIKPFTSTHTYSLNGQEVLDLYPYPWITGTPNYYSNDNPGLDLTYFNAVSATVGDQFEDYLMYFAPGSNQCVPLAYFVWSTSGSATIPATNNWANYGAGSAGRVTPSGTVTKFGPSNSFPMWTKLYTNGSF